MNYTQLTTAIADYCENSFSETELATFVKQAEQRIYNAVQLPALRKNVTGNLTSGNKYLACPPDYLSTFSLAVIDDDGVYNYLLNKDVNFLREAYPDPSDDGLPQHYAQWDANTFIVGPTPDQNYEVELHYFYYPTSIVDAGTSWLGDNFDSALLYGSLVEAYTFMKGEQDLLSTYNTKWMESMQLLKQLGDGKNRRDAYRSGQTRLPDM